MAKTTSLAYELAKSVIREFLIEARTAKKVVVYAGGFQPFHKNHYEVYKWLSAKFGADSVYIGTANSSTDRSVFSFADKKKIMTTMFGIPPSHIIQVKNPYAADEIVTKFDPNTTVHISAIGGKDATRIKTGKYYSSYSDSLGLEPYGKRRGYYIVTPTFNTFYNGQLITGTLIRSLFSNAKKSTEERVDLFKSIYGEFNKTIFDLFSKRFGINESVLIKEGGAAGHMSHPFDDMDLTFDDMANIINLSLSGGFKTEELSEKLDGQNIMVSWIDGELRGARNGSHIKNRGAASLNTKQISDMFAGRGAVHDAFTYAMEDLSAAIGKLSEKDKKKMFANGKKFMNLEVLYPESQNVIPYGVSMLKFHSLNEYDKDGNLINTDTASAAKLAAMIKQVSADVQNTYTIAGPSNIVIQKSKDFSTKKAQFLSRLNQLKIKFKLKGSDKVMKYHESWWREFIEKKARSMKYAITEQVLGKLVNRWAFGDKSYSISDIKKEIENPKFLEWVLSYDKNDVTLQLKQNIEPFEKLFLQVGAEVLHNASGLLASNPDAAVQTLKKELEAASDEIKASGDINKLSKLQQNLNRLKAIGGTKKIAPTEGIVFNYKGKLYKFTGSFAPVNQILGIMKFDR